MNVEALGLNENAGAVECGPNLRTVRRLFVVVVICACTGAATQPHASAWEAWLASGGKSASIEPSEKSAGGRARPRATQWGWKDAPEGGVLVRGAAAGVAVLPVDGSGRKMNGAIAGAFAAPAAYVYTCICTRMHIRLCIHPST